ncbi:MAG: hypothetical protein V1824_00165 [archaeon]
MIRKHIFNPRYLELERMQQRELLTKISAPEKIIKHLKFNLERLENLSKEKIKSKEVIREVFQDLVYLRDKFPLKTRNNKINPTYEQRLEFSILKFKINLLLKKNKINLEDLD